MYKSEFKIRMKCIVIPGGISFLLSVIFYLCLQEVVGVSYPQMFDLRYWRCVIKKKHSCPNADVKFYLFTPDDPDQRQRIDVNNPKALKFSGFDPSLSNVIVVHGFNGSYHSPPMKKIKKAYIATKKHNVFMVEWHSLGRFPCYLSALYNMRLVAQCTAQLYAFVMENGGSAYETTCIGHSLGAHICGMISNHLTIRQHRIIGLDPGRPLIDRFARREFRLTPDDAEQVQVIHTNAGFLGEINQVGTVDFCVNGGAIQPGCHGHMIRVSRCSHFQSVCYLAQTVANSSNFVGQPCSSRCPRNNVFPIRSGRPIPMGEHTPKEARGMYCVKIEHDNDCPFN